ncbi:hypothetical protein ABW21_db0209567 [Orbilia brochopaga]|nr:hypothetical protein ABW21_db0209567 [Drechslerella brochopaga]
MAFAVFSSMHFLLWVIVLAITVVLIPPYTCILFFLIFSELIVVPSVCDLVHRSFPLFIFLVWLSIQKKINIGPFRCAFSPPYSALHSVLSFSMAWYNNRSFLEMKKAEANTGTLLPAPFCKRTGSRQWMVVRLLTWRRRRYQNLLGGAVNRQQRSTSSLGFSWNGRGWIADRRLRLRCPQSYPGTRWHVFPGDAFRNTTIIILLLCNLCLPRYADTALALLFCCLCIHLFIFELLCILSQPTLSLGRSAFPVHICHRHRYCPQPPYHLALSSVQCLLLTSPPRLLLPSLSISRDTPLDFGFGFLHPFSKKLVPYVRSFVCFFEIFLVVPNTLYPTCVFLNLILFRSDLPLFPVLDLRRFLDISRPPNFSFVPVGKWLMEP